MKRHLLTSALAGVGLVSTFCFYSLGTRQTALSNSTQTNTPEPDAALINQFKEAVKLERQSRFKQALSLIDKLKAEKPSSALALMVLEHRLSSKILDRAQNEHGRGNIAKANEYASQIPIGTPAHERFTKVKDQWLKEQKILEQAEHQASQEILTALSQLSEPLKTSKKVQTLRDRIQAKIDLANRSAARSEVIPEPLPENHEPETFTVPTPVAPPEVSESYPESTPLEEPPERSPQRSSWSSPEWSAPSSRTYSQPKTATPDVACNTPTCDFDGFR